MRRCLLVLSALLFAVPAQAKKKEDKSKVKWKDVVELEAQPTTCEYLERIDDWGNSLFVFTGKQMRAKMKKKMQKATSKAGGNAYFVIDKMHHEGGSSFEAKAYWCEKMPTIEQPKNKPEDHEPRLESP